MARVGARSLVLVSLLLALAAALALALLPLVSLQRPSLPGEPPGETRHATLLAWEGPGILLALLVPVLVAAVPLALGRTRWRGASRAIAAVLLSAGVLVGIASIGLFYLPSAVVMVAAATRGERLAAPVPDAR